MAITTRYEAGEVQKLITAVGLIAEAVEGNGEDAEAMARSMSLDLTIAEQLTESFNEELGWWRERLDGDEHGAAMAAARVLVFG